MSRPNSGTFEEDYFRKHYPDYVLQNPARKMDFYRSIAERVTRKRDRPRVLEVGCAFGRFLLALGPRWERFGVDVSEFALEQARQAVPQAHLATGSATEPVFPGPFDLVAAFDVLEHVEDLDRTASTIASQLAPDGHLLFVVPVYDGPTGPVIRLLDKDRTHVHKKARSFWLDWTQTHFHLEDWWGIYRYLLPWGHYVHLPSRRLRRLTPAIAVLAGKDRSVKAPRS